MTRTTSLRLADLQLRIALPCVVALLGLLGACSSDPKRSDAKTSDASTAPSARDGETKPDPAPPSAADAGHTGITTASSPDGGGRDAGPRDPDASTPAKDAEPTAPPRAGATACEQSEFCPPAMAAKSCDFTRRQLTAAFQRGPALAWNGGGFGAAWFDFDQSAARFMALDPQAKPLSEPRALDLNFYGGPGLLATDTRYDFAIAESFAVVFLSIPHSGGDVMSNATPARREVAGGQSMPSQVQLVAASDGYAIVWRDGMSRTVGSTHLARVAPDGAPRATHVLGEGGDHHSPRAAWNGDGFGVVWSQVEGAQTRIRFREFDAAGAPESGDAITLTTVDATRAYAELIWTGANYAVAWQSGKLVDQTGKTHVVRLARGGQRIGEPIEITGHPAGLAWIGDGLAVLTYTNARGWDLVQIDTGLGFLTDPATVQLSLWNADLTTSANAGFKQEFPVNEFGRPLVWNGQSLTFLWGADRHVHVGQFSCR